MKKFSKKKNMIFFEQNAQSTKVLADDSISMLNNLC